jgi:glycosyltransferase involved in cell wall biosynthesis
LINQTSDPYPFLAAADIFLLPSREDPLPVSMLEAASFGIPIICFDQSGGTADFVKSGAGLSVPYLNVQEMASSIIRLSQNLETRQTMGDKGKSLVSMSHTAQSSIPQILDVLKNVALYRQTDSPNL